MGSQSPLTQDLIGLIDKRGDQEQIKRRDECWGECLGLDQQERSGESLRGGGPGPWQSHIWSL